MAYPPNSTTKMIFTNDVNTALRQLITRLAPPMTAVIADENTARLVLPRLDALAGATVITIAAGDSNKTLATLEHVWQAMQRAGATRHALVVNLGGGMVTDVGGLAAATFKRGVPCVNVPTTLLGAVDAAVGGKTGINYGGLKNEIGVFAMPLEVVISTCFFDTLPQHELRSGFAEMLKHALLCNAHETDRLLAFDISGADLDALLPLLETSVRVKQRIVEQDPHEHGLRRALNLGHTVGHALESHALAARRPVPHGYAVAWGLVAELVLSHMLQHFDSALLHRVASRVLALYGAPHLTCDDYDTLLELMRHDKKSDAGEVNCTLLRAPGDVVVGCHISPADVAAALDITRDLLGI